MTSTSTDAGAAATDLSRFGTEFRGPKEMDGTVSARGLFRGLTEGDRIGPYLSQFLMHPVPFGAQGFDQKIIMLKADVDFITNFHEFVGIQNGSNVSYAPSDFEAKPLFLRNGRDLSQYVHLDVLFYA